MDDDEKNRRAEPTSTSEETGAVAGKVRAERESDAVIHLDWRDWIALTVASLETILLPAIAIIVVLIILAIAFTHFG